MEGHGNLHSLLVGVETGRVAMEISTTGLQNSRKRATRNNLYPSEYPPRRPKILRPAREALAYPYSWLPWSQELGVDQPGSHQLMGGEQIHVTWTQQNFIPL